MSSENLDLIFQEVKDRLKDQLLTADQLATKLNFLLGFNTIVIAAIFPGLFDKVQIDKLDIHPIIIFVIAFFLLSIYFDLKGLKIQKYRRDPDPEQLYKKYINSEADDTKKVLISNYIASFKENLCKLSPVRKCFRASVILSSIALMLIFIFFAKDSILTIWQILTTTICQK
ncbi:MAG TPA: hypothetical protein PKG74_01620 [Candidatus Colwellbacteria bacterium]|nr:hypothetical protein [Candidatus Colwellbacteria bacterium]